MADLEYNQIAKIKVFGIGFILICLAVIIASYTIIRLRPKDILTKMEQEEFYYEHTIIYRLILQLQSKENGV